MTKSVALLFGVHAHQPVGNFKHVLEDAHLRCYGPFLRVLLQYPDFHFAFHCSGWLLNYLLLHYPQDMRLLDEMVRRGQAELFGAGYTEPVLAAIPTADRIGQIKQLSDYLGKRFGQHPQGAWLTERVWEASVVPALADSGIKYVTVDDYHFMCTGKQSHELKGFYTTEEDGRKLDLFPISEALRYRLPFSTVNDAVGYLESLADESGQAAAVYFDDIEKFGIWPETYEWVYEQGWLMGFIESVLTSSIIKPMRYSDYHAQSKTSGVVYLPTASYIEMNEWTLPVPAAHRYADLVAQEKYAGRYEQNKSYIRGGIWRNFFTRYPESNWMHKRMLALSQRYHALPKESKSAHMLQLLYEAQANDAYWHGLFGGLYLPHLRRAVYNAIVGLEGLMDTVSPRPAKVVTDLDMDGFDEAFLNNGELQAVIRLDGSASICELDAYRLRHNFGDTLARQTEHYHRKVHAGNITGHNGEGIANPHERVSFKHEITQQDMETDRCPRSLFLDHWQEREAGTSRDIVYSLPPRGGKASTMDFSSVLNGAAVQKRIGLRNNELDVEYRIDPALEGIFSVEISLAMPSCDGPAGRFRIGNDIPGGFGQPVQARALKEILLEDDVLGGCLVLSCSAPAMFRSAPHFSVSQSEGGFEKIMQAVTMVLSWEVKELKNPLLLNIIIK